MLDCNLIQLVKKSLAAGLLVLMAGCHEFGPDQLRATQPLYNDAIIDSINQQYLQNLVRLHYRDPTFFLDVSNVAATVKMVVNGSAGFHTNSGTSPGNFGAGMAYEITPTVTYSPLQGEDFAKSMLSPIPIAALLSLTRSGWSVHRVFGLCVESINGLQNAPTASGPTPSLAPIHDEKWRRLSTLFERVAHKNLTMIRESPDHRELQLQIATVPEYADAIAEIKSLLGLDPNLSVYNIKGGIGLDYKNTVYIDTRPLGSIFFYLSHRVDTPEAHMEKVNTTRTTDGHEFDWSATAAGQLFHVHQSKDRPDDTPLATYYRDHWFYIADNDLESKSTFLLLTQLFRLQAGAAKGVIPTLTIPVR